MQCRLCLSGSQWTRFGDQVSAYFIQHAFYSIWRSPSGLSKYHEICTFSNIFAKPGLMADTLVILALPSVPSLWLFPMSVLSFSPNCWSSSCATQDLVLPFTPGLLMNAHKPSCLMCTMHGMWFLNAGQLIPEASSVYFSSRVTE